MALMVLPSKSIVLLVGLVNILILQQSVVKDLISLYLAKVILLKYEKIVLRAIFRSLY